MNISKLAEQVESQQKQIHDLTRQLAKTVEILEKICPMVADNYKAMSAHLDGHR